MALPTGDFENFNIPDGTLDNLDAGQAVVFMDLRTGGEIEGYPSTCTGWCKEVKLTKSGEIIDFYQGMPKLLIKSVEMQRDLIFHFKGFEWNMDLFQMHEGNTAVESGIGKDIWGIGFDLLSKRECKGLVYHKTLDDRGIWIYLWKIVGDGNSEIAFPDDTWFEHDFDYKVLYSDKDFDGEDLDEHHYIRVETYDAPSE